MRNLLKRISALLLCLLLVLSLPVTALAEEAQDSALPLTSVMVTMVLLKEELICATPRSTSFFSRRLRVIFFALG